MKSLNRVLQGFVFEHGSGERFNQGSRGKTNEEEIKQKQNLPYLNPKDVIETYYSTTDFSNKDRYDINAPYNQAPEFNVKQGVGLPLTYNFDYDDFIKTTKGNNRETNDEGFDLPLYITLPKKNKKGSYQWDSFPAGEAQQFLVFSVKNKTINSRSPLNGDTGGTVVLNAKSSSSSKRPYTIALSITPYNAGPTPHIHWADDEAFIMLQGEMDSWIGDPGKKPYELYEFPEGNDTDGDNFPPKKNTKQLPAKNVETFYYGHLMAEDGVYLPRGHAHAYRNASPNGDPLVFLSMWSRSPGYPKGGIEEFFTLSEPTIGRFYDTSDEAASYGNLYNKNIGSKDAISNQKRFIDFYNIFPEYYVAISRNFGSFTSVKSDTIKKDDGTPRTFGGNWNPMIPSDTGTFPTPPPAAWDEDSKTPWIATPGEKGVETYFTGPSPNSPSQAVNFSTPFDPKIIQRISLSYDPSQTNTVSKKEFNKITNELANLLGESAGNEATDLLHPKTTSASSEILTIWDRFSSLDSLRQSQSFKKIVNRLKRGGSIDVTNSSVDSDLASNYEISAPEQMLLAKFEIADGSKNEVLKIAKEARKKTRKEPDNISFDFFLEKDNPNTIHFIEHYATGAGLGAHLQKSYTAKFFEDFAPHLQSGYLADGDISIYPVNTPESQFYIEQQSGVDMFNTMLESMPEMAMTLSVKNASSLDTIYVSNRTDTKGYGSFLEFAPNYSDNSAWTYGIIAVDNRKGRINNVDIGDREQPSQDWLDEASSRTTILFETSPAYIDKNQSRHMQVDTKSHYVLFRTSSDANSLLTKNGFADDVRLEFSNNGQLRSKKNKAGIRFKGLEASYGNVIQGMSTVTSGPQEKGYPIIDTQQQPRRVLYGTVDHSSTPAEEDSTKLTLVKCNSKGKLLDPLTGKYHAISSTKAQAVLANMEANGDLSYYMNSFELKGGSLYTPLIKKDDEYFTLSNTDGSIQGANAFGIIQNDSYEQFDFTFTHSEEMPLLD